VTWAGPRRDERVPSTWMVDPPRLLSRVCIARIATAALLFYASTGVAIVALLWSHGRTAVSLGTRVVLDAQSL